MPEPPEYLPFAKSSVDLANQRRGATQPKPYGNYPLEKTSVSRAKHPTRALKPRMDLEELASPKSFSEQISLSPGLKLGTMLLTLLALTAWVICGLSPLFLPVPLWGTATPTGLMPYITQLPLALVLGVVLGPRLTAIGVILITLLGFILPLSPSGSGLDLLLSGVNGPQGFAPQWEGMVYYFVIGSVSVFISQQAQLYFGQRWKRGVDFHGLVYWAGVAVLGVGVIHGLACLTTVLVMVVPHMLKIPAAIEFSWVRLEAMIIHRSLESLGYDLLLTVLGFWASRLIRAVLWIILY